MTDLDLQARIARIAQAQSETDKFAAEQRKLTFEGSTFERERTLSCSPAAPPSWVQAPSSVA